MKKLMDLDFWKEEFIKKFKINEIGKDLLEILTDFEPDIANTYILEKFNEKYERKEIIKMYADKDKYTINCILDDLLEEKLTKEDIEHYNIKVLDDELEEDTEE